jgi:GDP-4-dehydro-6-deoxy-D-mannose reductase
MKKVLVTGVNGFVGQHVAKELSEHGAQVVGIGGPQGAKEKSKYIDAYFTVDLTDRSAVGSIDFSDIDGVLHLAGLAAVGPSFDNPLQYIEANIGMEINLFEAAQAQDKHPKFVVVSSGSLYNSKADLPITEASPVLPNSPYAVSKIGQEQMALYYGTRGFAIVIARPFNHIGPGQNLGFIVPDLTQQVIACERGEAKEILVGNLDAKRDFTDVRDIATAYRLLLEKGKSGEVYNICTGKSLSGNEILSLILDASGTSAPVVQDPGKMRPSDTLDIYGSHDKLTKDSGWKPSIDIKQTIQDVISDWHAR